jgi:NitT/TauT family transport system permease protein
VNRWARRILIWAALILAWEALVRLRYVSVIVLPAPSDVFAAAVSDGRTFATGFAVTLFEIGVSITIAWTLGIISGVIAGNSPKIAIPVGSLLSSLFAVPLVILYPLFMAWIGIGLSSKIVFGVLSGYFPIALNTLNGVRAVEPHYATMARAMGANRMQIYTHIFLPFAIPSILSGLRIGTGLIVIGVVIAEMLASRDGIGFLISYHRSLFDTGHVYLGFIFVTMLALGVNRGLSWIEQRFDRWRPTEERLKIFNV